MRAYRSCSVQPSQYDCTNNGLAVPFADPISPRFLLLSFILHIFCHKLFGDNVLIWKLPNGPTACSQRLVYLPQNVAQSELQGRSHLAHVHRWRFHSNRNNGSLVACYSRDMVVGFEVQRQCYFSTCSIELLFIFFFITCHSIFLQCAALFPYLVPWIQL